MTAPSTTCLPTAARFGRTAAPVHTYTLATHQRAKYRFDTGWSDAGYPPEQQGLTVAPTRDHLVVAVQTTRSPSLDDVWKLYQVY